jgi:hypothetical protein
LNRKSKNLSLLHNQFIKNYPMRKILLSVLLSLTVAFLSAQTIVFHENFDGTLGADSVSALPTTSWSLSSQFSVSPTKSDSAIVVQSDTSILISNTFSTTGKTYVLLEFDQICKIEFLDAAEILVSTNNGSTWTQLTSSYYLGAGQFANFSNKFTAASYAVDWAAANPYTQPQNSWWKHETFDISTLTANNANVKVAFRLRDGNSNGSGNNYGWLLDNIKVTAAIGELIPPVITMLPPIVKDSVFSMGPFGITASITDASGIDTALLIYKRNSGSYDTIGMINTVGSTFYGLIDTIPAFSIGDTVCYYIIAYDNSPVSNMVKHPTFACDTFVLKNSPPPPGCTTPLSNFPFYESFDIDFISGNGSPNSPGVLDTNWTRSPSTGSVYMWLVHSGSTGSTATGPSGDHTSGSGKYMYTEASYGTSQAVAELVMPCANIGLINVPYLEFYYHMFGSAMGELHVDIYYGGQWMLDVMPAVVGDQGDAWYKASVNLSNYKSITKLRFRAIKGTSYGSDIAIDDIRIWEPPAYDAGMLSIDAPSSPAVTGSQNVKLSFQNFGSATLNKLTVNWQVNQVTQTPFVWTGTLMPGNVADSITVGQFNFVSGPSTIKAWTSLPNDSVDALPQNDTAMKSIIACTGPLHGTFVIGGSNPDFMTFTDAVYAVVNCGIDSPIVFNVAPGTYVEQIEITSIPGASDTNTVTFQSLNGDSTSVSLQYSVSSSTNNYMVYYNGASHVHFKGITVQALGTSYGRLFVFDNNASSNHIESCRLIMSAGSNYQTAGFYINNTRSSDIRIVNNDIANGYYGIYMRSQVGFPAHRNIIKGNHFHNYYSYGAYIQYQDSIIVENNHFHNDTTISYTYGLYLYQISGPYEVTKNIINSHGSGSVYGLRLYYCNGSAQKPGLVANNMITCSGNSTYPYALYVYNGQYMNIYHNSVSIATQTSINSRALYLSSGNNINIKNNIFSNTADGYTYYITSSTPIAQCDYNNLYTTGTTLAYWQGARSNLAALQAVSGKDYHSLSVPSAFVSKFDLHITNNALNNSGTPIALVPDDIDYEPRSTTAPSIGADEKPPVPIDAGVLAIIDPQNPEAENDTVYVKIVLKNFGTDTLPAFSYSYAINNVAATSISHPAGMLPNEVDTVSFPYIIITPGHNTICAFTLLAQDTNTFNDTLCKYYYGTPIIDMGVSQMTLPDSGDCYTPNEPLMIKIKNYGSQGLNMTNNPLTIHTSVTGPTNIVVPNRVLTTGTIMPGQEWNVSLAGSMDMSLTGDYHFDIWTTVNGDGDATNDSMEHRVIDVFATIDSFPYIQDFEDFTVSSSMSDPGVIKGGWKANLSSPSSRWYVGSGNTYSSNTGPAVDHTKAAASGKYMYTEAIAYSSSYTLLTGPCMDVTNLSHPTLRFWYHLYGTNIATLKVDVFASGQWHYQVYRINGHPMTSETDPWRQAVVDLSNYTGVIRIRFSILKSAGYSSDAAIDDIMVYDPLQHDAGVATLFEKPTVNHANTGTQIPVKIKIENYGLDTLTHLNVGYQAGNTVPVLENWTGTILPYQSDYYEFNTKMTAPSGEIKLCAFTDLQNDNDHSNDTSCMSYTGIPLLPLPYSNDFEGVGHFVNSGGNMQWERGTPNKTIFTAAHSPSNAWVTSLNDDYMNNSDDYLYTPFFDFTTIPNCKLSFYHRLDAQMGSDGGFVQYSTDNGQTWVNLGYMGDPLATQWYNANIGGSHLWSSPDSSWRHSTYDLSGFNNNSSVQFRFGFISNGSINNYDGWMIDDFSISPPPIATDAGVAKILAPSSYTTTSNSYQVQVRIKNYGTQSLSSIPIYYKIGAATPVTATWTGNLAPGATVDYTFATNFTATASYRIKVGTYLAGDSYGFNDTTSIMMDKDIALSTVFLPKATEIIGDSARVAISLQNFSTDTLHSFGLEYDLGGGNLVQETWTGSLAPGISTIYYFKQRYLVHAGVVKLCARVILSGDTKASNNESCKYISGVVSTPDIEDAGFALYQNQPNPFSKQTVIKFDIPRADDVTIQIFDLFGRMILQDKIHAIKGLNKYKFDKKDLATGLYFYEVHYKNISRRMKMLIVE